jgi:hypothetical protein
MGLVRIEIKTLGLWVSGSHRLGSILLGYSSRIASWCVSDFKPGAPTDYLYGLAGVIFAARFGAGQPTEGVGGELCAIASVVVGGTLLTGGQGSVINHVSWRPSPRLDSQYTLIPSGPPAVIFVAIVMPVCRTLSGVGGTSCITPMRKASKGRS